MELRHGMPVWAPSDLKLKQIASRVAKERAQAAKAAKAAKAAIEQAKHLFVNEHDATHE